MGEENQFPTTSNQVPPPLNENQSIAVPKNEGIFSKLFFLILAIISLPLLYFLANYLNTSALWDLLLKRFIPLSELTVNPVRITLIKILIFTATAAPAVFILSRGFPKLKKLAWIHLVLFVLVVVPIILSLLLGNKKATQQKISFNNRYLDLLYEPSDLTDLNNKKIYYQQPPDGVLITYQIASGDQLQLHTTDLGKPLSVYNQNLLNCYKLEFVAKSGCTDKNFEMINVNGKKAIYSQTASTFNVTQQALWDEEKATINVILSQPTSTLSKDKFIRIVQSIKKVTLDTLPTQSPN